MSAATTSWWFWIECIYRIYTHIYIFICIYIYKVTLNIVLIPDSFCSLSSFKIARTMFRQVLERVWATGGRQPGSGVTTSPSWFVIWTSHFQLETPRTHAIHMYFLAFWGDALSFWPWETQPVKQPWRDPHIADRLLLQGHHREPLWHRVAWLHCCNQGFQIIFSACTVKMPTSITIWY